MSGNVTVVWYKSVLQAIGGRWEWSYCRCIIDNDPEMASTVLSAAGVDTSAIGTDHCAFLPLLS